MRMSDLQTILNHNPDYQSLRHEYKLLVQDICNDFLKNNYIALDYVGVHSTVRDIAEEIERNKIDFLRGLVAAKVRKFFIDQAHQANEV